MLHPFRCKIEQLHASLLKILQYKTLFQPSESGVKRRNRDLALLHGRHLILHQRDERRDDQRQSRQNGRRQLVAEGFALPCRHDRHDIAPGQHGANDFFLTRSECRKPEPFLELSSQIIHGEANQRDRIVIQTKREGSIDEQL